jgi:DNA-binding CsgD family transcriptional regulator
MKMKNKTENQKQLTSAITYWTQPEQLELLYYWARDDYTSEKVAEKMGINALTLKAYRKKSNEIDKAIRTGKEVVDASVESALLKSARGMTTKEVKVVQVYKHGVLVETHKEVTEKEHVPSVLACTTWLYNRQRDKWKKNRDNESAVDDDRSINITITRAGIKTADGRQQTAGEEDDNESDS